MKVYTVFVKAVAWASYDIEAHSAEEAEKIFRGMEDYGTIHPYQDLQDSFEWEVNSVKDLECPRYYSPILYEDGKEYIEESERT